MSFSAFVRRGRIYKVLWSFCLPLDLDIFIQMSSLYQLILTEKKNFLFHQFIMTGGKSFSLAFYTSKTDIGRAPLENFYQVSQIAQPAKQNCGEITSKR